MARNRYEESAYYAAFSKRLRAMAAAKKMSGMDLARATCIFYGTIYMYLKGERLPRADNLAKLCTVLDVDANALLGIRRGDV